MPSDRHEPALLSAEKATRQGKIYDRLDVVDTEAVLRDPHAPDEDGTTGGGNSLCESQHVAPIDSAKPFQVLPRLIFNRQLQSIEPEGMLLDELPINCSERNQVLQYAIKEGDVPTLMHLEKFVC